MKKILFLYLLFISLLYAACPDCGEKLYTCSKRKIISFNGSLTISDRVKHYVRRNCCPNRRTDCCKYDVYEIDNVVEGSYIFNVSVQNRYRNRVDLFIGTSCGDGDIYYGRITSQKNFVLNLPEGPIYITFSGVRGEGLTDYSLSMVKDNITMHFGQEKEFELVNPENTRIINGNIALTGNSILCWKQNGQCRESPDGQSNAQLNLSYIDVDSDPNTYNSSSAQISIPPNEKVLWAGFFLQGYLHISNDRFDISFNNLTSDIRNALREPVKFKPPFLNHYIDITPNEFYLWPNYDWSNNLIGYTYETFIDLTDLFRNKDSSEVNGIYTVANIKAQEGRTFDFYDGLGNFGAWTLVIIHENNETEKLRNLTVFNGYKVISSSRNDVRIRVDGFYTPKHGPVDASVYLFAAEGDRFIPGDELHVNGVRLNNEEDIANNYFDSFITSNISRTPSLTNNNGIDIKKIAIGVDGNTSHQQIIGNDETTATFTFTSTQDTYFPSMISFSVEMYKPNICYIEKIFNSEGTQLEPGSVVTKGTNLHSQIFIKNLDYQDAYKVAIKKYFDKNDSVNPSEYNITYERDSTKVQDLDWSSPRSIQDGSSIDGVSVSYTERDDNKSILQIAYLGNGVDNPIFPPTPEANEYALIEYNFTVTRSNLKYKYLTSYSYEIGGEIYPYKGELPKCVDFNNSFTYVPPLGTYNVTNDQFNSTTDPVSRTDSLNSLHTQIVNKDFNVTVLALKDDKINLKNSQDVVSFDIVNANGLTEANDTSNLLHHFEEPNYLIDFAGAALKRHTFKVPLASRSAAFKIRYIDWVSLLAQKSVPCTNYPQRSNRLNGIPQCVEDVGTLNRLFPNSPCFSQSTGNPCSAPNGIGSSEPYNHAYGCIQCLLDHHAQYAYSRDNFAIRPDKFDIYIQNPMNIIAQHPTSIIFKALDGINQPSLDYNETQNNTFKVDINISDSTKNCSTPNLQLSPSLIFRDGQSSVNYKFADIGDFNVTIQEIPGQEFAIVDASDTPNINQRLISPKTYQIKVIPHHFKVNYATNSNSFTYLANEVKNMAFKVDLNATAEGEDNVTTPNYSSSCYAKSTSYTLKLNNIPAQLSKILIYEAQTDTEQNSSLPLPASKATIALPQNGTFQNGLAQLKFHINFKRNKNRPINPFNLALNQVDVIDTDNVEGNKTQTINQPFYYGRLHIPNQRIENGQGKANVYYEIYINSSGSDPAGIKGGVSVDDLDWYINTAHTIGDGNISDAIGTIVDGAKIQLLNSGTITNGKQQITLKYLGNIFPYSKFIGLSTQDWLLYDRYDPNVQKASGRITFKRTGGWLGRGKEFNDTEIAPNKNENRKVLW